MWPSVLRPQKGNDRQPFHRSGSKLAFALLQPKQRHQALACGAIHGRMCHCGSSASFRRSHCRTVSLPTRLIWSTWRQPSVRLVNSVLLRPGLTFHAFILPPRSKHHVVAKTIPALGADRHRDVITMQANAAIVVNDRYLAGHADGVALGEPCCRLKGRETSDRSRCYADAPPAMQEDRMDTGQLRTARPQPQRQAIKLRRLAEVR